MIHESKKLLTVIIPAYNVAPYIRECLNSVLNQQKHLEDLEIIIVIDGATDNTSSIIRSSLETTKIPVKTLIQHNLGLSAARNRGLSLVKTDYVTFLDGDDCWEPGYLSSIIPILFRKQVDLVEYDAVYMSEEGRRGDNLKISSALPNTITNTSSDDFLERFLCYTWARVYRSELVRSRLFPHGLRFEDCGTTPWYYWNAKSLLSIGQPLIAYRQRSGSILSSPTPKDVEDLAQTIADAASMYRSTGATYWQRVAHRTFQQACRRTTWLSPTLWPKSLQIASRAIQGVPAPPGFTRWLQANATLAYTLLLYLKRSFFS